VLSVDASETILETVDRLKELLRANDEAREEWPGDLLERLGASGDGPHEPAVSAPSTRGAAHPHVRSVVDQCDEVMRTIDARRGPEAPLSSGDWRTLGRALGTLGQVSGFAGVTSVCNGVQTLVTLCESSSEEGAPPPLGWEAFRKQYRDVVGVLSSRPETAPASIRPRGRTVSLRPPTPAVQPSRAPQAPARAPAPQRSVRVDHEKLDVLMGAIGELLVAKNALPVLVSRVRGSDSQAGKEIKATVDRIAHIADDLQDAMRQIRMMPISSAFQRFPRMIRDLARSENKQVQLIISGDETELDKTVLEAIGDPLMHLVRNAVDHGIELPADRLAHGKPAMGTVGLEVLKEGANVVIRISDDGRGMDPARLRAKALEKGLLSEADAAGLSDKRALELIFLPGFSTAEVVTDISGRGVGMDVVQSNIRQLHGTVAIASDIGRGTVMLITLPSSLMVSKGMLVECANEKYVLPIEGVREMVKLRKDEIRQFRGVALANVRGSVCAVYSLARLLGLEERGGEDVLSFAGEEASAAIVSTSGGEIAVVVDRLVAEIDVLVKPLAGGLDRLALFQGATILGDGSVALILDVRRLDALVGGVPRDEPAVELAAAS